MIRNLVEKSLDTTIAPMIYIMMFVSVVIGFCFTTGLWMTGSESVLYDTGVLIHRQIWGIVLFTTAMTAEIGFLLKKPILIKLGGLSGFSAWLFASISLLLAGHWYVFATVALFHLLFHGYVYLSTSLGVIYRKKLV